MTARISKISVFGIMIIKFNDTLKTDDINIYEINSENTKIKIIAANQRDKEEGFNKTDLDFTWYFLS